MTEKEIIPLKEVEFHSLSFVDENGRFFRWRGVPFRAITPRYEPVCRELFEKGIVQRLIQKGLIVKTEMTGLRLEGYSLVLKHHKVPFVSYSFEWCPEMLKAAALTVIDLETELAREGFELQDGHALNVLFDGGHPVFVDFSSIVRIDDSEHLWRSCDEFHSYFVYPLKLMSQGYGRIVRKLLFGYNGISRMDYECLMQGGQVKDTSPARKKKTRTFRQFMKSLIPSQYHPAFKGGLDLFKATLFGKELSIRERRLAYLERLRGEIERIDFPHAKTEWSDYYDNRFMPFERSEIWTEKHRRVHRVLSELRPESLLDIGSNRGWYSQLAAMLGSKVVAFDEDAACVSKLYADAREKDLAILPLVMDFRNPSPAYGLNNQWLSPATERFKCEMVLALALVHHLAFHRFRLKFDAIAEALSRFTNRWLLVEFIPQEDEYVSKWNREGYSWYTQENFLEALRKKFRKIQIWPSEPSLRVLILCEK